MNEREPRHRPERDPEDHSFGEDDIKKLLDYENPASTEYQTLIENEEKIHSVAESSEKSFENFTDPFGPEYLNRIWDWNYTGQSDEAIDIFLKLGQQEKIQPRTWSYRRTRLFLADSLKNQTLVELGGANNPVVDHTNLKSYIAVDRYHHDREAQSNVFKITGKEHTYKGTPIVEITADMLDFSSRLNGNSVNFSINAIDSAIISSAEYRNALVEEITRATKPGGIVFGARSPEIFALLNESPYFKSETEMLWQSAIPKGIEHLRIYSKIP